MIHRPASAVLVCCFLFAGCTLRRDGGGQPGGESGEIKQFTAEELRLPGKRGACMTLRDPARSEIGTWDKNLPRLAQLDPYWNYSWGADWVSRQDEIMKSEFVPMIWGAPASAESLKQTLREKVAPRVREGRVKRILGFNEPDKEDQAGMPYMQAVELWPLFMELGIPLCSPACANPEGIDDETTQGVPGTWMRDFMREADRRGYRVDYTGVHWYGGCNAEAFKAKLRRIHEKYGRRPLLITEFAPAEWRTQGDFLKNRHTPEKVLAFAKEVLPWMERQDWIAGYAWFSFGIHQPQGYTSALFKDDGTLTALGRYYASITSENPAGDQSIEADGHESFLAEALAAARRHEKE